MSFRHLFFGMVPLATCFFQSAAFAQGDPASVPPPDSPEAPCSWAQRACRYPHLVAGLDLGLGHFNEGNPFGFKTSVGSITSTGPTWGVRVGAELAPWFAIEAHYMGMSNGTDPSVSAGVGRHLFTNALVAEFRFTAPLRYVQPYAFIGAGVYSTSLTGSSPSTEMTGSTELGVPVGIGLSVPVTRGISLGVEGVYHRLFNESFSANEDIGGGEPSTASLVGRVRF